MFDAEYYLMFELERTHWWFVSKRGFIRSILQSNGMYQGSAKRIVDIGSGTGGNIPLLRSYGRVIGVEPHPTARRLARKRGIHLRKGTAEKTGLQSGSADMACFFDVLYHRGINDLRALKEAYRVLRPGGTLVITDSALPLLGGPHDIAMQARERYVLSSLIRKVEKSGFSVRKASYIYFILFPIIAFKRMIDRVFRPNSSRSDVSPVPGYLNTACAMINKIEAVGLTLLSYPWGSSLIILAWKPPKTL